MILMQANEATATKRRVFFHLVDAADYVTPETGEDGGQPQVSLNGITWTDTGIGTLVAIGNGRYYAELTQTLIATAGVVIETRYKSAATAECPGDSAQIVAYDPHDADALGLANLDTLVNRLPMTLTLNAINEEVDTALADYDGPTNTEMNAKFDGVAASVWNALTAAHQVADSFGLAMTSISPSAIATAVWSVLTSTWTIAGTAGALFLARIDAAISSRATPQDFSSALVSTAAIQGQFDVIYKGMDHLQALNNALQYSFPHGRYEFFGTGIAIKLTLIDNQGEAANITHTASVEHDEDNAVDIVTIELTSAQTAVLSLNDARSETYPDQTKFLAYRYKLSYTLTGASCGAVVADGFISVQEGAECAEE